MVYLRRFVAVVLMTAVPVLAPALAADISVDQANGQFSQTKESISRGDDLLLVNKDSGPHDISVIDEDGDPTDLGVQAPGATVRVKFPEEGLFTLRCAIAPTMRMSVSVN